MNLAAEFSTHFPQLAQALGAENLDILLNSMTVLQLPAYRKMIRDRMPVDSLYFLVEGEVSISVEENDCQISLGELGPGQWLGEVSVLSGELLASSTVTTLSPVKLLRLKHQAFDEIMKNSPAISGVLLNQLTDMLAERLRASLSAGAAPITLATDMKPRKRGLMWTLFGSHGG